MPLMAEAVSLSTLFQATLAAAVALKDASDALSLAGCTGW